MSRFRLVVSFGGYFCSLRNEPRSVLLSLMCMLTEALLWAVFMFLWEKGAGHESTNGPPGSQMSTAWNQISFKL